LTSAGALRAPARPRTPRDTGTPSANARSGWWQVAQRTERSAESNGSKKSRSPNDALAAVSGFPSGAGR
jgi:hypothetical protein